MSSFRYKQKQIVNDKAVRSDNHSSLPTSKANQHMHTEFVFGQFFKQMLNAPSIIFSRWL